MARDKKPFEEKRTQNINITITVGEKESLMNEAKSQQRTLSDYVRMKLFNRL